MIDYAMTLTAKFGNKQWALSGNDYDGLEWLDDSPKPTNAELMAMWPQVDYDNQCAIVEQQRLKAYESTSDPIYFEWQRGDATEQEWLDAVQAVKNQYPYPPQP